MSDDTPTQRFDTPAPATPPKRKSNRLLPLVIIVGLILIAAIVVLIIVLLSRGANPQPTALESQTPAPTTSAPAPVTSSAPAPTPSESHVSAPPPPPNTNAAFTKFIVPATEAGCQAASPDFPAVTPNIKVTWATVNAKSVWIVQGTSDAADSGFMQLPLSGNESDFPYPIMFECSQDSNTYTMTIVGNDGRHVSKSWTVVNKGDKF